MKWILGAALGLLLAGPSYAVNYAIQDGGAGSGCQNAWPPSIVGNYNENGTLNGVPRYDGSGWYLYRASIFGQDNWVVSNSLGSTDLNNSTIAFYAPSSAGTPVAGTGYNSTNSACGKINVQQGVTVPAPDAPTIGPLNSGVQPYISGGSTTVYWSGVPGVVGYKLDVATDAAFTTFHPGYNGLVITASPTPPTSATVTGLSNAGTTYYFRVRSYNGGGDSVPSATVSTTTVPAAPTLQTVSNVRADRFTANWAAATGADAYRLQVCTDAGFTSCIAGYNPASVGDSPALVSGLAEATTYYYRVSAGNANGYSAYSSSANVTTNTRPSLSGSFMTSGAVNDNATIAPFTGVTVSDANGDTVSVQISYAAANGTLAGTGLTGSAGSYVLTAQAPATVTTNLRGLVFTPTYQQGPTGSTVTTTFTLVPDDGTDVGTSNSTTKVTTTMTNVAPSFVGATTTLTVSANAAATDIKSLLHVSDTDTGQTETWSAQTAPVHGTLTINGTATASGGTDIAPSGTITYTPASNYSGNDSFAVRVSDGSNSAVRTITVTVQAMAPGAPTGVVATPADGQASVSFSAPSSNGGSAVTGYTVTSSPQGLIGSAAGSPITVSGLTNGTAYTFTVIATNAIGSSGASSPSAPVTPKGEQTITFVNPGAQNFGTSLSLTASATSGLPVSFSSTTPGICTVTGSGALTLVSAGNCTIVAAQTGDNVWNAATTVSQTFAINAMVPGAPTIGTATAGNTQATITFTAPASNGGSAIATYTATSNPDSKTGTCAGPAACPITVSGLSNGTAYTFTVTATNSAGTGAASAASNSVIPKAVQTISFANPGSQNYGTSPDLAVLGGGASATSGLPVAFTSSTLGVCTITPAGVLTFGTAGTCTINADQAGNSVYLAAPQVSRSFTVTPIAPGAPTIGTAIAGDTQASVAFTAPANTGGTAITGYTVTVTPPDVAPVYGAASPIVVTGLTNGQAYTFTVTADNSAGTGPASSASNSVTPKAIQSITFANPGSQNFGTTPTLSASATSGLAVAFTSSTTGVCTITSGGALTFVTAGSCTINADQAGNGVFLPAPQVSRSFTVNAQLSVSGAVPGMAGLATATLSGGGASCTLNPGGTSFMAPVGMPGNLTLPHGGFEFLATGCSGSVTITLNYPDPMPAGIQFWKFGPATAGAGASTWFAWSGATLSPDRRTVSYTVTDNGVGDSDNAVGSIRDPFAPAFFVGSDAAAIPVNNPWALAVLVAVLGWLGLRRRHQHR